MTASMAERRKINSYLSWFLKADHFLNVSLEYPEAGLKHLKYSFELEVGTLKKKESHKKLFDPTNKISCNKMSTHDVMVESAKANRKKYLDDY